MDTLAVPPVSAVKLPGHRRSRGHCDVFTSPAVVRFMLDKAGYTSDRNLSAVRVLEPSCGDGEFLVEIANRLQESARRFDFDAETVFNINVRAYEIDPLKVRLCQERLQSLGIDTAADTIVVEDFLHAPQSMVDIVVGNPPYIRYEHIPKDILKFCRDNFETFHYRCDLYVPFFEKSLSMLAPGGRHCFICSNRWLRNEYGRKLRKLVAQHYQLRSLINLERAKAFLSDVLAYPAITVIDADRCRETFVYSDCAEAESLAELKAISKKVPEDADWSAMFNVREADPCLSTIESQGFKIGVGVATGADSVFISPQLPQLVEPSLILPGINARDLRGNELKWQGEFLLNPYNPDGSLLDLAAYPKAEAYLSAYRERLSSRHVAQKAPDRWYKTIDRINPQLRSQPKILLPDISGNTYIFVDEGEYYPLHNIYYVVGNSPTDLKILAAFLMSDFVREQLAAVTNQMNGGFVRWQSQHLRKLKIPNLKELEDGDIQEILKYYELKDAAKINAKITAIMNSLCR